MLLLVFVQTCSSVMKEENNIATCKYRNQLGWIIVLKCHNLGHVQMYNLAEITVVSGLMKTQMCFYESSVTKK